MGFPVPLQDWVARPGVVRTFVTDILSSQQARSRPLVNNRLVLEGLGRELKYGRKLWGFLCLELWQRAFHDRAGYFKQQIDNQEA
jgi:asparagine synthase (glutamine-hydrolysing)